MDTLGEIIKILENDPWDVKNVFCLLDCIKVIGWSDGILVCAYVQPIQVYTLDVCNFCVPIYLTKKEREINRKSIMA